MFKMETATMKPMLATGLAVLIILFHSSAQELPPPPDDQTQKRMDAARAAFLTERLDLSTDQAQRFWPVYNEFNKKRHELRRTFMEARRKQSNPSTPEEQRKLLDLGINLRQQELDLEKSYTNRFLQVISAEQVLQLNVAERDFQQMVARHLRERRTDKPGKPGDSRRVPAAPHERRHRP